MDCLEHLKSSPALQLLKQLDTPLAIARETVARFDWVLNAGCLARAIKVAQEDQAGGLSSIATAWESAQSAWTFDTTPTERAIEAIKRDWARDISSLATAWKTAQLAWAFDNTAAARAAEAIRRDLARDSASLATTWTTAQAALALDTAPIARALQAAEADNLRIAPAWAASIFLERVNPPRMVSSPTTQIQLPDDSFLNKSLSNYGMAESYDLFSDFERDLRYFIRQRMSDRFGSEWEETRLPRNMCKSWQEKREKAILAGELPGPLINYADFTDYVTVITQKDNWEQLFKGFFGRPQLIQESLYRLHPIRVCIMHARLLPREMQLVLKSEIMLLSKKMWN